MKDLKSNSHVPSAKLDGFDNYGDYLEVAKSLVDLEPQMYGVLYNVLVKLQSLGQDPLEVLQSCRYRMARNDCVDMLKFMIYIENLDLAEIGGSI